MRSQGSAPADQLRVGHPAIPYVMGCGQTVSTSQAFRRKMIPEATVSARIQPLSHCTATLDTLETNGIGKSGRTIVGKRECSRTRTHIATHTTCLRKQVSRQAVETKEIVIPRRELFTVVISYVS